MSPTRFPAKGRSYRGSRTRCSRGGRRTCAGESSARRQLVRGARAPRLQAARCARRHGRSAHQ
eukprot:2511846-Alexandrium_andersonii.AAC.1